MDDGEKRISLKIDLKAGTIELDAPESSFDQAIARTRELTQELEIGRQINAHDSAKTETTATTDQSSRQERPRTKSARLSTSAGRAGRIGSFDPIRDLLNEEQQQQIRAFVLQKSPKDQGDAVLCAMYEGERILSRQGFSYNEIYTLMWRAGTDPLPKALDVMIQKLSQEQYIERGTNGYFLKFLGRSRVEKELPVREEAP